MKTYATMASNPPPLPPIIKPQSPWEIYIMGELKKLQQEVSTLKTELTHKETKIASQEIRIAGLEAQLQDIQNKQEIQAVAAQEATQQLQETQQGSTTTQVKSGNFVNEVLSVLKENERAKSLENYVRIGGLPEGWSIGTNTNEELEGYILDVDIIKERLTKVVPFIDLGDPTDIEIKGKQARVRYYDMMDKIKVMKHTESLQGTSVWISDELTPLQLKNRAGELAKVREARKQGKWAVYRGGKAIIRDFKGPPPF